MPAELRGGTYEREGATAGLLRYRTHSIHGFSGKTTTIGAADDRDM